MSWFDEAIARKQREQREDAFHERQQKFTPDNVASRQQQEVEALSPLIERLLSEYGQRAFCTSLVQKRFIVRLERPGRGAEKSWHWHWHLDSLVKNLPSVEVHPQFASDGSIQRFLLISGRSKVKTASTDETGLKEALVGLYLNQ